MEKKLLAVICASVISAPVFAVGAFDGVNAQIGVGMGSISSQDNASSTSSNAASGGTYSGAYSSSGSSSGKPNVFGTAALGYSYGFANKFNLAANVFYLGGSDNAGSSSSSWSDSNSDVQTDSTNFKLKNTFGVAVEPGYYFGDKSLGYLKLGWAQSNVSISSNSYDNGADPMASSFAASANTQGFLYGLGFKQMIADNIYLGVEAYQIQYANKSFSGTGRNGTVNQNFTVTVKPTMSYGGLVLGYKF